MAKKPDLSDLTKKIDIGGIVKSLKTMINPEGALADVDPSDAMGMKIKQITAMMRDIAQRQAQQADDFTKVHNLMISLFEDLEALRHPPEQGKKATATKAKPKEKKAEDPSGKLEE